MAEEKTHHIRIKIGDAEFEATGPSAKVQQQFKAFKEMVSALGSTKTASDNNKKTEENNKGNIDEAAIARIFQDSGDLISLTATPATDDKGDSLLLLLYGYTKLKGEPKVTGVTLMKAARQSGVIVNRIDRFMNTKTDYILSGGAKRGRRYSLNNRGLQHVETIIKDML